jgi:prepilin-type N-terminal cleavage/methylation domain-containing protein
MKLIRRPLQAFTLIELLVVISIIAILASLAIPAVTSALTRGQMTQTLNNARQLHIATQTMSIDSTTAGNGVFWTFSSNVPLSVAGFTKALLDGRYLTIQDITKLYGAPGVVISDTNFAATNIAFKIFAVQESSPADFPFLVTRNWDSMQEGLGTNAPYADKGFVLFRKGGDGAIFTRPTDATNTNVFGTNTSYLSEPLE